MRSPCRGRSVSGVSVVQGRAVESKPSADPMLGEGPQTRRREGVCEELRETHAVLDELVAEVQAVADRIPQVDSQV